jgi:hypothetical protein
LDWTGGGTKLSVSNYLNYFWKVIKGSMSEMSGIYTVLVEKPEGKRPLERPRRRWEDNIKMGIQEVECGIWTRSSWFRIGTSGGP